jgi:signal peptidase II
MPRFASTLPQAVWAYGAAVAVLALDQLTKQLVRAGLPLGSTVAVTPWFNLRHVINRGGAFSLLYGHVWLLALVAGAVTIGLVAYERRHPGMPAWRAAALGILLAGTLGNLVDRLVFGQVTDFLDLHLAESHWPTFNVADIAINLGVAALIVATALAPTEDPAR